MSDMHDADVLPLGSEREHPSAALRFMDGKLQQAWFPMFGAPVWRDVPAFASPKPEPHKPAKVLPPGEMTREQVPPILADAESYVKRGHKVFDATVDGVHLRWRTRERDGLLLAFFEYAAPNPSENGSSWTRAWSNPERGAWQR